MDALNIREPPPKRPLTSFFIYLRDRRPTLKEEQPNLGNKELTSKISEEWRGMNAAGKSPYEEEHKELKMQYAKAIEEYTAKHPNWKQLEKEAKAQKKQDAADKAERIANAPKPKPRPKRKAAIAKPDAGGHLTGFTLFLYTSRFEMARKLGGKLGPREGIGAISGAWYGLSSAEKQQWNDMSRTIKEVMESEAGPDGILATAGGDGAQGEKEEKVPEKEAEEGAWKEEVKGDEEEEKVVDDAGTDDAEPEKVAAADTDAE